MTQTQTQTSAASPSQAYERVDHRRLAEAQEAGAPVGVAPGAGGDAGGPAGVPVSSQAVSVPVRWWVVLPVSLVLCGATSVLGVLAANMTGGAILGSTLVPVTAFGTLFVLVMAVNPLLRLGTARRFGLSGRELMCIFAALLVTSGIPGYGLAHQLVPVLAAPFNPDWNTPQRGWSDHVNPHLNLGLFVQDEAAVRAFYEGQRTARDNSVIVPPGAEATWGETVTYWWQVTTAIRWEHWVWPLVGWGVFIAASYGLFYGLVYLVLPSWSQREKLIFPLAKVPESLLPDDSRPRRLLPPICYDTGFWISFSLVFLLLSYNAAVRSDLITATGFVPLGMTQWGVRLILEGTILEGIAQSGGQMPALMFLIIFTAIGIAFLLPVETSFSIWSYYLAGLGVMLVLVWTGYGSGMSDFPSEWLWENNPVTALGAGGLLTFAGYMLVKAVGDYARYERRRATWASLRLGAPALGALVSLVVLWGWLIWVGLAALWAALFLLVLVLVVTGILRIVAESGVFWMQLHTSFFHLYRTFGLGKVMGATLLVPLLPLYWVLYLDVKAFLGASLLNAAKMEEDTAGRRRSRSGTGRGVFHLNLVLCIVLTVVGSVLLLLVVTHLQGGYQMNRWFFASGPPSLFDRALNVAQHTPEVAWGDAMWYLLGAGYLVLTLRLRRSLFWWPHPIGFIMLCNPLIAHLWFSFLIGWICKKIVVKYGGKTTFDRTRGIFLGLIIGEIVAIFLWTILGLSLGLTHGLTLNRYGA